MYVLSTIKELYGVYTIHVVPYTAYNKPLSSPNGIFDKISNVRGKLKIKWCCYDYDNSATQTNRYTPRLRYKEW